MQPTFGDSLAERIKLDHFEAYWDRVEIAGSGTVTLDPDLQPSGSVSATIKG
jgi:hypothetical protein